ncbi:hypothetical protein RI138_10105 [Streptomyces sp. C11-1]|uniref:Uncharacterized protein n=1 Tax=Streptomyces durocortorensis TaxID=2811104 RepID=A0ABY9VVH9_9ACTN|nr:hypothetical protein [Streptomyces durocortorensis]WNF27164.1 hypothetical protein RI138_10105 [Streptomyces durocortorensis]
MSNNPSRNVSDRLRAIDWADDAAAFRHAHSRALLMREYLRRAALWAQAYEAEQSWPFFDITGHVDAGVTIPPDVAEELEQLLKELAPASLRTTCRGAVRWAELRAAHGDLPKDLPDPYEPLLLMYERGGGYYLEEYLDLNGVMIPLRDVRSNASATPFITLAPATLDALDAEGEMTYFAKISDGYPQHSPRGIVRRRVDDDGRTHDEAFTRNLRWEPTEYLRLYDLGHNETDHVRITEIEAAAFIESLTEKFTETS